jgi:hypothetical protein
MIELSKCGGRTISKIMSDGNMKGSVSLVRKEAFEKVIANGANRLKTMHILWCNTRYPAKGQI